MQNTPTSPDALTTKKFRAIIQYLRNLIKGTQFENHTFAVGGCVRDMQMGLVPHDIDICIDIENGGILLAKFLHENGYTSSEPCIYERYGTASVVLKEFGTVIEMVQTRQETYNGNDRNPETCFGPIEFDAYRRDLTINALYLNVSTGEVLDITGKGLDDIKNKVIRTASSPDIIFNDDPLRILRVIRFAHKFGNDWTIQPEVLIGIEKNSSRLSIITRERICSELMKMTANPETIVSVMNMLRRTGCLEFNSKIRFSDYINYAVSILINDKMEYIKESPDMQLAMWTSIVWLARESIDDALENSEGTYRIDRLCQSLTFGYGLYANTIEKPLRRIIRMIDKFIGTLMDSKDPKNKVPRYLPAHELQYECGNPTMYRLVKSIICSIWNYSPLFTIAEDPEDFFDDGIFESPEGQRGYDFRLDDVIDGNEIMKRTGCVGKQVGEILNTIRTVCLSLTDPTDSEKCKGCVDAVIDNYNQTHQNAV